MTLQDLGAIGELVSGVAVIFSLVYVAYQIRQNSRLIEQNSRQLEASMYVATSDAFNRWWALFLTNDRVAEIWRRGLASELESPEERSQFHALMASLFVTYENGFYQKSFGAVNRDTLAVSRESIQQILGTPGGRFWWTRHAPHNLTPPFRTAIDALLAAAPAA